MVIFIVMKRMVVIKHVEIEGPGLFSKIAEERGFEVEVANLNFENNFSIRYWRHLISTRWTHGR